MVNVLQRASAQQGSQSTANTIFITVIVIHTDVVHAAEDEGPARVVHRGRLAARPDVEGRQLDAVVECWRRRRRCRPDCGMHCGGQLQGERGGEKSAHFTQLLGQLHDGEASHSAEPLRVASTVGPTCPSPRRPSGNEPRRARRRTKI